jgi:hypothetical protein
MYWESDANTTEKMLGEEYTAVPLDEKEYFGTSHVITRTYSVGDVLKAVLVVFFIAIGSFTLGFGIGQNWKGALKWVADEDGLLPPQAFLPNSTFVPVFK